MILPQEGYSGLSKRALETRARLFVLEASLLNLG